MGETRQRILAVARALFNKHGLSQVGVRDVARAANMSPGNLAYHFATKDELVAALLEELYELNRRTVLTESMEKFSLIVLYKAALTAMRNMLDFRFVLLSYADAVQASPRLRDLDAELAQRRRQRHDLMLAALIRNGFVGRAARGRSEVLYEQGSMISSGWLTAAVLRGWSDERAMRHFAKLGCSLLAPFCTDKGKRQLRRIERGDCDKPPPTGRKG